MPKFIASISFSTGIVDIDPMKRNSPQVLTFLAIICHFWVLIYWGIKNTDFLTMMVWIWWWCAVYTRASTQVIIEGYDKCQFSFTRVPYMSLMNDNVNVHSPTPGLPCKSLLRDILNVAFPLPGLPHKLSLKSMLNANFTLPGPPHKLLLKGILMWIFLHKGSIQVIIERYFECSFPYTRTSLQVIIEGHFECSYPFARAATQVITKGYL